MNIIKLYGGLALVVIGAILLFMEYLKWLSGNWVLLLGLFFIVAGVITHVRMQKHHGKY